MYQASIRAFSSNIGNRPLAKIRKKDRLKIKIEINAIEQNKGSEIYPQNQVFLDWIVLCQAYRYHLSTSVLSIILICVIVSHLYK